MPLRYSTGSLLCSKCGEYIRREDVPKVTRRSKNGQLLHECGWAVRQKPRRHNNMESQREDRLRHRSPIQFSMHRNGMTVREDIIKNMEKWNNLVATE